MGDFHHEEFTPEELAALGEAEKASEATEDKGPETQEAAETPAEEAKPEEKGEEQAPETEQKPAEEAKTEEGTVEEEQKDPVQKRIDKLTWEKNEERRKRELAISLGPERFFELYPEEKPEGWQPQPKEQPKAEPPPVPVPSLAQLGHMKVQGGQYDGYTLNEVAQADPMAALAIRDNYLATVHRQREAQAAKQREQEIGVEVNTFRETRAFEMFGKPLRSLTKAEIDKIGEAEEAALAVIEKPGHGSLKLEHAYHLSRHEAKRKADEAAKAKLDKVTDSKTVKSISTAQTPGVDVEWQGFLNMTPDQLTRRIDKMSDKDAAAFYKDAPKAVRDKFKSLPWD